MTITLCEMAKGLHSVGTDEQSSEDYVVGAVERWDGRYRMLLEEDGEDELDEKYEMPALKQLLGGDIKQLVDLKEQELTTYAKMRNAIMTWAVNKRMEK